MQELLITSCWVLSILSAHDKLRQCYTLNNVSECSWTQSPHTSMMTLSTEQVTWCSAPMQMQDTSMRLDPTAEQVTGFHPVWSEMLQKTLAACGLEELFSQLCCCISFVVVVARNSFRCYLPTIPVVLLFLVAQVSFLVVAGKGFSCYLLTNHTSCAVVSVFWFRREIVFGCTVSKKDSYLVSLRERGSAKKCVYFVRSSTLLLWISFTTLQSRSFLNNIENFLCK